MAVVERYYFEDGNTVRVAEPDRTLEEVREYQRRQQEKRRKAAKRNKAKQARKNKLYTKYMISVVAALFLFFVGYVYLQTSITTSLNNISELETEITELKAENSATTNRINTSANLQNVKNTAINDLGMVYANADQIVYYNMENTDYMTQYSKIP